MANPAIQRQIAELEKVDPSPPEDIEAARAYVKECLHRLSISQSFIATVLMSAIRVVYTNALPTMAVTIGADGFPMMMVSPKFALKLANEPNAAEAQGMFVLAHEAFHLVLRHIYAEAIPLGEDGYADTVWEIACEASINNRVKRLLHRPLPAVDGQPTGVDPDKIYDRYAKDLRKQGLDPVSKDDFYSSDFGCYSQLKRMKEDITPPKTMMAICMHGAPGKGDGKDGQGKGQPTLSGETSNGVQITLDQEQVDKMVSEGLALAVNEARQGNKIAREELLDLEKSAGDSDRASKLFGDLGLGALRGETVVTRKTDFWYQWLWNQVATLREDAFRLQYNRRITWEPTLTFDGDEDVFRVLIAVDASGSMRSDDIKYVADRLGEEDGIRFQMLSFDGVVAPFELGQGIVGGGGTNFQIIDDYVQHEMDEDADCIIVFTDGYAPHITPRDPEKWVWLIVPGGDTWPERHEVPMATYEIDTHTDD